VIYLTAAQLLRIHSRPPAETGDTAGVRDLDLLEAAGAKPQPTLDGGERYPDVHGKAAAVMDSRVSNHPFVDGNKRGGHHRRSACFAAQRAPSAPPHHPNPDRQGGLFLCVMRRAGAPAAGLWR